MFSLHQIYGEGLVKNVLKDIMAENAEDIWE
jgi:hypothetical protein